MRTISQSIVIVLLGLFLIVAMPLCIYAAQNCSGCPSDCFDSSCDPVSGTPCDASATGTVSDNICCGCGSGESNASECQNCNSKSCTGAQDSEGNGGTCCGEDCDPFEEEGE